MTDVAAALQDAWTELRIHRGRVLMSLIGVTVAIAALTASVALGQLAQSTLTIAFESQAGRAATLNAYVSPGVLDDESGSMGSPSVADLEATLTAIEETAERFDIEYASPTSGGQFALAGAPGEYLQVDAADPDYATMRHLVPSEGRFLADSDRMRLAPAVVVNRGLLNALGGGSMSQHRSVEIGGVTMVVVGVIDRGLADESAQAWVLPRSFLTLAAGADDQAYLNDFQLEAWVPEDVAEEGASMIERDLAAALPGSEVSTSRSDWGATEGNDPLLPLQFTLIGTSAVILLLCALGLLTVAVVSIRQRVREFGIRRAFGASRARVFVAVMLESVVGTVFAGAVGIALCIFAYRLPVVQDLLLSGTSGVPLPGFPMAAAIVGLIVSAAVGALVGCIPATIAVRSKVIEAIRF